MNIAQHVERGRSFFPDKAALIYEDRSITYADLDQLANRVANGLLSLGVGYGDRVALLLPNIPEFVTAYLGIQKIGAIVVSLNVQLTENELRFMLVDCAAKVVITTDALCPNVPQNDLPALQHLVIAEGDPGKAISLDELMAKASATCRAVNMNRDDQAAIVYSSGTTGFPKGVTLSHGNVISNAYAKNHYCGMRPDDRVLLFLPLYHCFGQNAILNSGLNACSTIVIQRSFDPERVLRTLGDKHITMLFGIPTVFILLLEKASVADLRSVAYCFSAAAMMPETIARQWHEKFGIYIHEGYGLSESSPFASYNHQLAYKYGSIGSPIENVEMKIIDLDSGQEVDVGETGEIVIRGPNVMLGYWQRPEDTAQVIRDGWLHSGDIGKTDELGYFYLVDRLKDMINVAGLKVYPAEVEQVIAEHFAVSEVAVYGLPDPVKGEQVQASIVLKTGQNASAEDIFAYCRGLIANFKIPTSLEFVDALPKNPTGKVLRRALRT